jgi:hypothetical protein
MIYKILGQMTLPGEAVADSYEYTFEDIHTAKDYYRECIMSVAETISDFGGTFAITMLSDENGHTTMLKRNIISTTINEIYE